MTNGHLDEIDLKILNMLQEDGRMEAKELSARVNLSRWPVAQRVEKLVEQGFIKRFRAIVDREKVGRPVLMVVHVALDKQTTELLQEFERYVCGMPEVQACLHVTGNWNFILLVSAGTPQAYYTFLMEKIKSLPNMRLTDSAVVMREAKSCGPLVL